MQCCGASLDQGLKSILKRCCVVGAPTFGKRGKEWICMPFTQQLCERVAGNKPVCRGLPRSLFLLNHFSLCRYLLYEEAQ